MAPGIHVANVGAAASWGSCMHIDFAVGESGPVCKQYQGDAVAAAATAGGWAWEMVAGKRGGGWIRRRSRIERADVLFACGCHWIGDN